MADNTMGNLIDWWIDWLFLASSEQYFSYIQNENKLNTGNILKIVNKDHDFWLSL